ncbi:MAG: DUF805 domain-containing protein [Pseudomonadota bacterium]
MGFSEAVRTVLLQRYADFQGRSPRSEYWWFQLAIIVSYVVLLVLTAVLPILGLLGILYLGLIIPALAVTIRRLHDLDKSGWWILIGFIPLVGFLLLYWYCLKGTEGDNQFGPDPLGDVAERFS